MLANHSQLLRKIGKRVLQTVRKPIGHGIAEDHHLLVGFDGRLARGRRLAEILLLNLLRLELSRCGLSPSLVRASRLIRGQFEPGLIEVGPRGIRLSPPSETVSITLLRDTCTLPLISLARCRRWALKEVKELRDGRLHVAQANQESSPKHLPNERQHRREHPQINSRPKTRGHVGSPGGEQAKQANAFEADGVLTHGGKPTFRITSPRRLRRSSKEP